MLVVTRLGVGVGEAVCAPAGTSWIGDLFPPHKRSRALAFFMLAVPLGHRAQLHGQRAGGAGVRLARGAGDWRRSRPSS